MANNKTNIKIILLWILSITAFIQMKPYFVWRTYGNGISTLLIQASLYTSDLLIIFYLLISNRKINRTIIVTTIFLVIVRMYMLMTGPNNTSFLHIGNYAVLISIAGFFFLMEQDRKDVFNKFATIFAISLISGIIIWILTNLGISLPYQVLQTEHAGKAAIGIYYQKYFGSAFLYSPYDKLIRLNAVYDEPGVVGTFSSLFLIADDFRFKDRFRNIIILIGGVLSFSLAFYVIVVVGIIIKLFQKGFFKFSVVLIIALVLFQNLITMKTDNVIIREFFQTRFQVTDGSLAGDNRANESFNYEFDEFIHDDLSKVLFGYGVDASNDNPYMYGNYTYKMLIYDFGITGFMMFLGWIIYATIKTVGFNKKCMVLLIVFIISIYQRPYVFTIPYMFLLFGGYANLKNMRNEDGKSKYKLEKDIQLSIKK